MYTYVTNTYHLNLCFTNHANGSANIVDRHDALDVYEEACH